MTTSNVDVETENQILSIGNEFLPAVARRVRDKQDLTDAEAAEYRAWIAGQVAQMDRETGTLCDYLTGETIRAATRAELDASLDAAERDGGAGVIEVDGRRCFVQGGSL